MRKTLPTKENWLLNFSGLAAIGLAATLCIAYYAPLPNIVLHLVFAVAFMAQSFSRELGISEPVARACIVLMLLVSYGVMWLNTDTISLILAVVLMASAPHHFSPAMSWLLLLVANLGYLVIFEAAGTSAESYQYTLLTLLAFQLFAVTSSLAKQREVAAQLELERRNSELLAARALIANQSQADERLRIAGELHDTVGHDLTALQLQLEVLAHEVPDTHKPQVQACQSMAHRLLDDIRSIVRRMSQEQRDDLAAAVRELDALTPGVQVQLVGDVPALEPDLVRQLVFCFQEAISNAIRHGRAASIAIRHENDVFHIVDDGLGLRSVPPEPGFGLDNIGKRLKPFGGHTTIGPAAGRGCELQLHLKPGARA